MPSLHPPEISRVTVSTLVTPWDCWGLGVGRGGRAGPYPWGPNSPAVSGGAQDPEQGRQWPGAQGCGVQGSLQRRVCCS